MMSQEDDVPTFVSPEVHEAMREAAHARHVAYVSATQVFSSKSVEERLSDHRAMVDRVYGPSKMDK